MKTIFAFLIAINFLAFAQTGKNEIQNKYKGSSVLGNGKICVVYSDDFRVGNDSLQNGIQHFYFNDFTADYIYSTRFEIFDQSGTNINSKKDEIILDDFFTAKTVSILENYDEKSVTCFVHPNDVAILTMNFNGENSLMKQRFILNFRKKIFAERIIELQNLRQENGIAITKWTNGNFIAVASKNPNHNLFARDSVVEISSRIGNKDKVEIIIAASNSFREVITKIEKLRRENDLFSSAETYWNNWMDRGFSPDFSSQGNDSTLFSDFYKRNLYSVKSSNLNGQFPNNLFEEFDQERSPEIILRDALMCARVFILTDHFEEAAQIINFWKQKRIQQRSRSEKKSAYKNYAVKSNSEDEKISGELNASVNGYFIQILEMYYNKKNVWLADKNFIYELADHLVKNIDQNNLINESASENLTEYLPSTNMISAAALKTASKIAESSGDKNISDEYKISAQKISSSLKFMFDEKRKTYVDVIIPESKNSSDQNITAQDTFYLWNTSMNLGILWGFENTKEAELSNLFYIKNTFKDNGGVQYFDEPDAGSNSYGHDLFFFTTAASAQYHSIYGSRKTAKENIDWMMAKSNIYGLMHERICNDQNDCSPVSPDFLSCAEFVAAIINYNEHTFEQK